MSSDSRQCLVIVPGVGNTRPIYYTFARRWERLGYRVEIISFGWSDYESRLQPKLDSFLEKLDALHAQKLDIIGISAGGTAAILAMAYRPYVHRVITVCSPLDTMPRLRNPLLAESIEAVRWQLGQVFSREQKRCILSVHALHDPVVHPGLSRPAAVPTLRVPMAFHPAAIYVALILYARRLHGFLQKAR